MDNSPPHSFCPCTSPLSAQTVLGSRCSAFWGKIAHRPLNGIVCNIYKAWYFQSVFMYCKSFSLHYHAECDAEVEGKEGKYTVFMSRLSMQLLGSAGSYFCLIKGWLMNEATEVKRKIETGKEGLMRRVRASAISSPSTHMNMWKVPV